MAAFPVSILKHSKQSGHLLGSGEHQWTARPQECMNLLSGADLILWRVGWLTDDNIETTWLPALVTIDFPLLVLSWEEEKHWVGSLNLIVWLDLYYFNDPCYVFTELLYHSLKRYSAIYQQQHHEWNPITQLLRWCKSPHQPKGLNI